jgi:hypothetical protein
MKRTNAVGVAIFGAGFFTGATNTWVALKGVINTYNLVWVFLAGLMGGFIPLAAFYQKSPADESEETKTLTDMNVTLKQK